MWLHDAYYPQQRLDYEYHQAHIFCVKRCEEAERRVKRATRSIWQIWEYLSAERGRDAENCAVWMEKEKMTKGKILVKAS